MKWRKACGCISRNTKRRNDWPPNPVMVGFDPAIGHAHGACERCNPSQQTSDGDGRVDPRVKPEDGHDGGARRGQYVNSRGGWDGIRVISLIDETTTGFLVCLDHPPGLLCTRPRVNSVPITVIQCTASAEPKPCNVPARRERNRQNLA